MSLESTIGLLDRNEEPTVVNRFAAEDEGFTLVELLVVVLIIGILAAIALPSFLGQQQSAQEKAVQSDARSVASKLELCAANSASQDYNDAACTADSVINGAGATKAPASPAKSGGVSVTTAAGTYTITGYSKNNKTFTIYKTAALSRRCQDTAATVDTACAANEW